MLFFIMTNHKSGLHQESFAAMCLLIALILLYRVERGDAKELKSHLRKLEVLRVRDRIGLRQCLEEAR